jgi:hypothetical protein
MDNGNTAQPTTPPTTPPVTPRSALNTREPQLAPIRVNQVARPTSNKPFDYASFGLAPKGPPPS